MSDKSPFRKKGKPLIVQCSNGIAYVSHGVDCSTLKAKSKDEAKKAAGNCNTNILINDQRESK